MNSNSATSPYHLARLRVAYYKLQGLVSRFKIQHAPFPIELKVKDYRESFSNSITLQVILEVKHWDTGLLGPLIIEEPVDPIQLEFDNGDDDYWFSNFRSLIRKAVLHEIDECLYVDGERRFDPHK